MDNDADDFDLLYQRDPSILPVSTEFGWRNLSFISQIKLPDGTVESFPTTVYKVIGNASSEREAAERWFAYIDEKLVHFTGGTEDFADIYRPYSQTPYTPEPGYLLLVGEAGSPSSTGLTTSAFRSVGLKAEQFFSPEKGRRTGSVEIGGTAYYHDGNRPLSVICDPDRSDCVRSLPDLCVFFQTLEEVENYDLGCLERFLSR